jgi:hypothetical protein
VSDFTLWRADLPTGLQRWQITLLPHTELDCSDREWQDCMFVVEDGVVVLSCAGGDLPLDQGSAFFVTRLTAPVLRNGSASRVTITAARRAPSALNPEAATPHLEGDPDA